MNYNDEIRSLREEFDLKDTVNLPVIKLANELGLKVRALDLNALRKGLSGVLRKNSEGQGEIIIDINHHPNRQRFTIAHEIAHFILHNNRKVDENMFETRINFTDKAENEKEKEANRFAAELLVPGDLLTREWDSLLIKETRLLALKFNVSESVLRRRVGELGLE
ncbi:ImmA/IrrE family metallo-endopeptidase [uncultured Ilyobacter sp.]|uniref:ImmA/IrrE family metallo-endopeptidase n=1 Tax=uncultured Ilyobacter sp. TaxID=544433 RepID=UPI0029C780A0|nr:ImmA/IrrE family metallo-endopeptidase [uncultured Ilyobacter sp.]